MDTERARVTLEVWWVRLASRVRTLLRALAVLAVALAGGNLLIGAYLPPLLAAYRPAMLDLVGTSSILLADIALLTIGLVTVLALSLFPRR